MEYMDREEVPIWETGGFGSGGVQSKKSFINSELVLYPGEFMLDVVEGRQAFINYGMSTFFNWKGSLRLLFWWWSLGTRDLSLKEKPTFRWGPLPVTKRRAQNPKALIYPLLFEKLSNFITRGSFPLRTQLEDTSMSLKFPKART